MLELRLEPEAEDLLEKFAAKAGQTKAEFARQAILDHLEDLEDYEIGVAALRESEGKGAIPFEEVVKSLGMAGEFSPEGAKATAKPGRSRTKANSEVPVRKTARIA
jgi:RHH-type transcriptional regulator, rel operon repressor / antitoxin RelB